MNAPYIPPSFGSPEFNCPHCQVYASQFFGNCIARNTAGSGRSCNMEASVCLHCGKGAFWDGGTLVWPEAMLGVEPNPDLNEDIKADFNEARSIIQRSPRGACALLRLCLQKLCLQLGLPGKNINDDIKELVKRGLTPGIQKGLDTVRVIGNYAVHPGELNLQNNPEIAIKLCKMINYIAEIMITNPKQASELFDALPEPARKAIEQRDGASPPNQL